jgi:hypothetical protein
MAEVVLVYRQFCRDAGKGRIYAARACADALRDGTARWHSWLEFWPVRGDPPVITGRETTQPNRVCTVYWATGLTPAYLDGALRRAIRRVLIRRASIRRRHRTPGFTY